MYRNHATRPSVFYQKLEVFGMLTYLIKIMYSSKCFVTLKTYIDCSMVALINIKFTCFSIAEILKSLKFGIFKKLIITS